MAEFVQVAQAGEIPPGQAKAFVVGDVEVAVFNVDGTFHAIDNACPHQGGPLAEGFIEGKIVTCPWHAWCFDVTTGKMTTTDFGSVDAYDVRLEGSAIGVSSAPRT